MGSKTSFPSRLGLFVSLLLLARDAKSAEITLTSTQTPISPTATSSLSQELMVAFTATSSAVTPVPRSPPRKYYFYSPDKRGAHAFYSPLHMIVANGFEPLGHVPIHEFDWVAGVENLGHLFSHPIQTIDAYGWKNFLEDEFVPFAATHKNWIPNYQWHLIGGGFRNRLLEEYFIEHEAAHPKLYAWLSSYTYHLINEIIQASIFGPNIPDSLADLIVFDSLGKLLFDIDAVSEFASETLHLRDWTHQTHWRPLSNTLFNGGQLYWLRLHLIGPLSLSVLTGEQISSFNGTFEWGEGEQLSLGLGVRPNKIIVNADNVPVADEVRLGFGLIWSRQDNPVVVATLISHLRFLREEHRNAGEPNTDHRATLTVNLYPGWFDFLPEDLGLTFSIDDGQGIIGIASGALPVGFAFDTSLFQHPKDRD